MAADLDCETINRVEVLDTGEFMLGIEGQGSSMYQYVYREAAGVYWDEGRHGFKSTQMKEWSCSQWCGHIIDIVQSGLGVQLQFGKRITWHNVPDHQRVEIERGNYI
jgi:hypothetical protein